MHLPFFLSFQVFVGCELVNSWGCGVEGDNEMGQLKWDVGFDRMMFSLSPPTKRQLAGWLGWGAWNFSFFFVALQPRLTMLCRSHLGGGTFNLLSKQWR
jgi:hypothetical protein